MKKKVLAIIEARMNSKRLFGKVIKKLNGVEILKNYYRSIKNFKKDIRCSCSYFKK